MAKVNYQYEKRQKELAKKRKKEQKEKLKQLKKEHQPQDAQAPENKPPTQESSEDTQQTPAPEPTDK